ncbi:bifunctional diaminohydroxyphosphoribosylaminopyrimidine deaminase/5-amino-6-(5-phosphoribosylamino)uracil reductase RibD [Vulgatibacter incomptus]|uniref:Riboflavin biosynthesis protein RibD n=1 Tax=Vulgatibacter incomptus TaxID=1391653 RepID=A0A0K1PCH9_9BACT|nr:bifunctional diaminohydroxyphosphoribosylaminopyrimidine deaminase/5-amino-6-(5-phosphoribosylamino)uracil reductase RibD [Vulgatibacter incomptus]AKU91238.1 Diaminohydroxyphosphoribosylaminopyrimidine deaminase [Vulgatibacter incomptus]
MSAAESFMRRAIEEARKALGRTSPNPPVGAVLVKEGRVVGVGHHARAGGPHAEAAALADAGEEARGADLYVTLEPCDHQGRTPPCSAAIVRAGVARVFVGTPDPNPIVSGRGIQRLEAEGIPVEVGPLEAECEALIEGWTSFIRSGRPWVIAKVAATLDGRIATRTGDSRWITGDEARARVHRLRDEVDAVIVGRGTVEADDPLLTARIPGGRDPLRVILDSGLGIAPDAKLLTAPSSAKTLIACVGPAAPERADRLRAAGAEVVECASWGGRVDLAFLLAHLAARGVVQVLVEGGARVFGAFLEAGLVDRLLVHYGPVVFGGGPAWTDAPAVDRVADALRVRFERAELVGGDLLVDARPIRDRG